MSTRWPEDVEPAEIPSISKWISNGGYNFDGTLPGYPGGRKAFDMYFEAYADANAWRVRRKWRVQIISMKYGGKNITEPSVKERFHTALKDYNQIQITNDNLGGDPQPGTRKEFVIEYRNLNNEDDRFLKRRRMMEGETLDVSWDITKLIWGDGSQVWSLDKFPKAFENLFWALDHGSEVEISTSNMDCDPAPGRRKALQMKYGSSKQYGDIVSLGEGDRFKFTARWKEIKKAECVVM